MDERCIFCDIVSGRAPARFIYRDATACSFLDVDPVLDGHALVVPRRHVSTVVAEGAAEALAGMAEAISATGRLLTDRLGADGLSVFQSNGEVASQEVFHLHFHLVPRAAGDPQLVEFPPNPEARQNLDRTHRRLTRDL